MLYPVCSRVGRGSLVLRHCAPTFRHILQGSETQRRALPPEINIFLVIINLITHMDPKWIGPTACRHLSNP